MTRLRLRLLFAVSIFPVFALLGLAGCEPKSTSSITGKQVTAAEAYQEGIAEEKRLQAAKDAAAAHAASEIRRLGAEARAKAAKIQRDDAAAIADLQAATEAAVAQISDTATVKLAEFNAKLAAVDEGVGATLSSIEAQRAQLGGLIGAVTAGVGTLVPGAAPVIQAAGGATGLTTLLLGAGGIGVVNWRGRKNREQARSEARTDAKKQADESREREHKAWDEAHAAATQTGIVAALRNQTPAAAPIDYQALALAVASAIRGTPQPVPPV